MIQIIKVLLKGSKRRLVMSAMLFVMAALISIPGSRAFLEDVETSTNNIFNAGSLVIGLRSSASNFYDEPLTLNPTTNPSVGRDIIVQKFGSLDMKYSLEFEFVDEGSSSAALCDAVNLQVIRNWYEEGTGAPSGVDFKYNGPLSEFAINLDGLDSDMMIPNSISYFPNPSYSESEHFYIFDLTVPPDLDPSLQNKTCKFNIKATGWQTNFSAPTGGFVDTASLDNQIATEQWSSCQEGPTWVAQVVESSQGMRKNGTPVTSGRTDPNSTLGAADDMFFSLGMNGWIIDRFEYPVIDVSGDDISIHETTYGRNNYPEELARVEVSQDGENWFEVGIASSRAADGVSYFDISGTPLSWVQFVRVTETSDWSPHSSTADGFDLNAIDGVYGVCASEEPDPLIVLNEFLPNPIGDDDATKPGGEWVELYNLSASDVDVAGWFIYDALDDHELEITTTTGDNNGNPFDAGETVVPAGGYLVVYRNGDGDFALNNEGGDAVRLYNGAISSGGILQDSYSYTGDAPEGKSYARIPDGVGAWVDPFPTPGRANVADSAELEPTIKLWQQDATHARIGIFDASNYDLAVWEIRYQRDFEGERVLDGFADSLIIDSNNIYLSDLLMGTESSGVEYPHTGISEVELEVSLSGAGIPDRTLYVSLDDWNE